MTIEEKERNIKDYKNPYAEQYRDGTRANDMDFQTQKPSGMHR